MIPCVAVGRPRLAGTAAWSGRPRCGRMPLMGAAHGSERRRARAVIAGDLLALAFCAGWPLLSPVSGGPWMPHLLLRAGNALHDCAALALIFFVPGTALVLSFSRRNAMPLSELLACGFAANVAYLVAATSLIKLGGTAVDRPILLSVMAFAAGASMLWMLRPRRLPRVTNDLPFSLLFCAAAVVPFILLFAFLGGYTSLGPRDHWLIEQVARIRFPGKLLPLSLRYEGGGASRDGRFVELPRGEGRALITNTTPEEMTATVGYLVRSAVPGEFTVSAGKAEKNYAVPEPFLDQGRAVRFQNQAVAALELTLPPGEREIVLRFADASGSPAACTVLDFTGLTHDQFLREFDRRYRFVTCVLMYDIMEADDFASNLVERPYIYHSPGTPEMEGYAVTNPPLSYIFGSFGYILMGRDMAAINKVAYAVLAALLFVSVYLAHGAWGARIPMVVGALSLTVVLTAGVSLHFMTHFMVLCIMLAFCCMFEKSRGWFLFFALMGCFSGWAGYYFCAAGLLCYALLWHEWKWALRQFTYIILCFALFLLCLFAYGHSKGVLRPWLNIMLWENFSRFGTVLLYQPGSRPCFLRYALICSGFLALAFPFTNDRKGYFFLLFSAVYCATLMAAPANMWKIHYLTTLSFPLMIFGGRGLGHALNGGGRAALFAKAALWACAIIGFAHVCRLAMHGTLILC